MYFSDRYEAGSILADRLQSRYRDVDCAVVALNQGAALVADPIASRLKAALNLLLTEDIQIPGEGISFGAVSQEGGFTFNSALTEGQVHGYVSEFHGYLEEQKRQSYQRINRLLGEGGVMDKDLLRDRVVVLVSDGINTGTSFDVAIDYLKPLRIKRLVVASPTASVEAVDKLHVQADELHILDVKANFMGVDHYYDDNTLPPREEIMHKISQHLQKWTQAST